MRFGHRRIFGRPRVMAVLAFSSQSHVAGRHVVDIAMRSQLLVDMAVQTVGRVGAQRDGVNHLLPQAVMTGGAGSGPVGVNIVLDGFDFFPVRHNMTDIAEQARGIKGEIIGTDFHRVLERTMIGPLIRVATETGNLAAIHALLNGLPDDSNVNCRAGVGVTDSTIGTVQRVNIGIAGQGTGSRSAEYRGVAGMAATARWVDNPVVMCRVC